MAYNNLNFAMYSRVHLVRLIKRIKENTFRVDFKTAGILKIFFEVGSTAKGYQLTILDKHKNLIFWGHLV